VNAPNSRLRRPPSTIVRPNEAIITQQVYEARAERWAALWPKLSVTPW
jgi:hypothetical protein